MQVQAAMLRQFQDRRWQEATVCGNHDYIRGKFCEFCLDRLAAQVGGLKDGYSKCLGGQLDGRRIRLPAAPPGPVGRSNCRHELYAWHAMQPLKYRHNRSRSAHEDDADQIKQPAAESKVEKDGDGDRYDVDIAGKSGVELVNRMAESCERR